MYERLKITHNLDKKLQELSSKLFKGSLKKVFFLSAYGYHGYYQPEILYINDVSRPFFWFDLGLVYRERKVESGLLRKWWKNILVESVISKMQNEFHKHHYDLQANLFMSNIEIPHSLVYESDVLLPTFLKETPPYESSKKHPNIMYTFIDNKPSYKAFVSRTDRFLPVEIMPDYSQFPFQVFLKDEAALLNIFRGKHKEHTELFWKDYECLVCGANGDLRLRVPINFRDPEVVFEFGYSAYFFDLKIHHGDHIFTEAVSEDFRDQSIHLLSLPPRDEIKASEVRFVQPI